MTEQEYREDPGINKSTLWEIRKSPMHYKYALENPGEDTAALKLGRAIHMKVLQPEEFDKNYAVAPAGLDRRTKEGKAAWAALMESGKEILSADEFEKVEEIGQAVRNNKEAAKMLEGCETEVPLFWDDVRTGLRCKCRVDAMKELEDRFLLIDLKTAEDAQLKGFTRSAVGYGYHVQAAHYINGVTANGLNHGKPVEWWFIAVEKKPPYAVSLIRMDQGMIDEGQYALAGMMDEVDRCRTFDEWPGYPEDVMMMPKWALEREE